MHTLATSAAAFGGTDVRAAARIALGETPELPVLPALADRGIGADPIGRTAAFLVDLPVDTSPRAWKLSDTRGRAARRAADFLDRDLDAMEEQFELARGAVVDGASASPSRGVRVEVCGPWTLAAKLELPGGRPALSDSGARRDVAESLREGLRALAGRIYSRLGVPVRFVLEEPLLWHIAAGAVPAPSEFDPVAAVPAERLATALSRFAAALRAESTEGIFAAVPCRGDEGPAPRWGVLTEPPAGEPRLDGIVVPAEHLLPWSGRPAHSGTHGWADGESDPQAFALLDVLGTFISDGGRAEIHRPHLLQGPRQEAPRTADEAEAVAAQLVRLIDRLAIEHPAAINALSLGAGAEDIAGTTAHAARALAAVRHVAEVLPRVAS